MDAQAMVSGGWKRRLAVWCRFGIGSLLLVAGLFKFWQVFSGPPPAVHFWESPWLLLLVAHVEFVLGVFLLFGIGGLITWAAAVFCFSVFLVAALVMAIMGLQDCGCFGPIKVNPWYTAGLDLVCLMALLAVSSSWKASLPATVAGSRRRHVGALGTLSASLVLFVAGAGTLVTNERKMSIGTGVVELGGMIVIDPEQWIARPFPLLDEIQFDTDIRIDLERDSWVAVFYRDDCSTCKDILFEFQAALATNNQHKARGDVVFIRVPPFEASIGVMESFSRMTVHDAQLAFAHLPCNRDWFIQAPLIVDIDQGVVNSIHRESLESVVFSAACAGY